MVNQFYSGPKCYNNSSPTRTIIIDAQTTICTSSNKGSACTYVWIEEKDSEITDLGWGYKFNGISRYIGFTENFNLDNLWKNRPFTHRNDLLSKSISDNWICICFIGLDKLSGKAFESLLLSQSKLSLSKMNAKKLEENCLVNKRREVKCERSCHKYLNLETQWK